MQVRPPIDGAMLEALLVQEMELMLYSKMQRVLVRSGHRRGAIPGEVLCARGVVRYAPTRPNLGASTPDFRNRNRSTPQQVVKRYTPSGSGSEPLFYHLRRWWGAYGSSRTPCCGLQIRLMAYVFWRNRWHAAVATFPLVVMAAIPRHS